MSYGLTLSNISKFESITGKPYIGNEDLSEEELLLLICICTGNSKNQILELHDDELMSIYYKLTNYKTVYKSQRQDSQNGSGHKVYCCESIYARMFVCGIPIEAEDWPIYKLLSVISATTDLLNEQNGHDETNKSGYRKSTKKEIEARKALNAKRKAEIQKRKEKGNI